MPVLFISALAIYMQCNHCTVQCIPIIADHSKLDLPCEADGVRHPKQRLKLDRSFEPGLFLFRGPGTTKRLELFQLVERQEMLVNRCLVTFKS